jgi:hypothetical protein
MNVDAALQKVAKKKEKKALCQGPNLRFLHSLIFKDSNLDLLPLPIPVVFLYTQQPDISLQIA